MSFVSFSESQVAKAVFDSISLMPEDASRVALLFASKHIAEVKIILQQVCLTTNPRILDIGCGTGVTISAIKLLLPCAECHAMDRFIEFSASLSREAGETSQIIDRLSGLGIIVFQGSFSDTDLYLGFDFDCITSFDVIEHLCQPLELISFANRHLNPSGKVVIGTPNQVHLLNRVRSVLGMNTWENFSYWISDIPFFGHVRELTPSEIKSLPFDSAVFFCLYYVNWPLSRLSAILRLFLHPFFSIPGFGLYMIAVYKKF
jgi:SAM-dependent methyltransferase